MKRFTKAVASISMVGTAALLLTGLNGCDILNPEENEDSASITVNEIGTINVSSGLQVYTLEGQIKGDPQINDVDFSISRDDGGEITGVEVVTVNFAPENEKSVKLDDKVQIQVSSAACNGSYTLMISVEAGTANSSKPVSFTVAGATDCEGPTEELLTDTTVTLGNQEASTGSALDVDSMKVHGSSAARNSESIQASVDVWFGIVGGEASMMAPSAAPAGFSPAEHWSVTNNTLFEKVQVDFDDITTQSELNNLWTGSSSTLVTISAGDVFVIETVDGNYRLLEIVSASDAKNGEAVVTGKIK
ncbi:MAG: hypothetical protein ACOCW2_02920 [Chitinivibrionales bacterium]